MKVSEKNSILFVKLRNNYYFCTRNAQYWVRITKIDMEIQRYNRLRAAIKRVQSGACFDSDELSKWREPSMLAWELPSRFEVGVANVIGDGT